MPPVTAERSPPASRMTGADSPVIADSSTEPMPSMIVAVGGDHLAGLDDDDVAAPELGRRDLLDAAVSRAPVGDRRRARRAQRVRLGLAAALGDRLGEVGEERRSARARARSVPVNQSGSLVAGARTRSRKKIAVVITLPISTMNMTGLRNERPRVELPERVADRRERRCRARRCSASAWSSCVSSSRARLSSSTFTPGSPKKPSAAAVGVLVDQLAATRSSGEPAHLRRCGRPGGARSPGRCAGRCPEAEVVTASTGMSPIREAGVVRAARASGSRRRAPARPSRGRGSSGRGWRRSSPPALYSGAVAEGRGWKYCGLRERLRGELRADDLAVALDQAAVRLVREGELREAGEERAGRRGRRRA